MRLKKECSITILLLVSLSCQQKQWTTNDVSEAIKSWELENSIEVNPKVAELIDQKFSYGDQRVLLKKDVVLGTELYLYDLRDRKRQLMGTVATITLTDSRTNFPIGTYDFSILRKPKGFLTVNSEPDGAIIRIDGAIKGQTNRKYVLSPGKHTISVTSSSLDCVDEVIITNGESKTYDCPK